MGGASGPGGTGGLGGGSGGNGGSGLLDGACAVLMAALTLIMLRLARRAEASPVWRAYLPEVPPA
jgi:hypothetical protein